MYRAYKTELDLNNKQRTLCAKHAGTARYAYNWALARVSERISKPNAFELSKEWVAHKNEHLPWVAEVSKCCAQAAFADLQEAFKRFFQRCRQSIHGKKGHPKRRSKKRRCRSFRLEGNIRVAAAVIVLPKLGKLRLNEHGYLPTDAKILSATVSERAGRWFVSLQVDAPDKELVKKPGRVVGLDLGITTLATASDGEIWDNPQALKSKLTKLARLNRQAASPRKEKGSNNQKKAYKKVAKCHYRISCVRKDAIHKMTTCLTKTKSKVVIEDLNVVGMVKNRKLSKAVSDCGFGEIRRQLEYKGLWYGCEIVVADRFFPSSKMCSRCGHVKESLSLKDRVYVCEKCGLVIGRDSNAANNLEEYPNTVGSTGINAFGEVGAGLIACGSGETDFVEEGS